MSDPIQSPSQVIVNSAPPQTFDPKDIVQAANGVISGDGKGFMPLTDFPPTKPYEDWKDFLEKQRGELNQERDRLIAEDPKTFFEDQAKKLEEEKSRLEQQHKSDLEARLADLRQRNEERLTDQTGYYTDEISARDKEIGKLNAQIQDLEANKQTLFARIISDNDRRIEENTQHYEARIKDMKCQRDELRDILQSAHQAAWTRSEKYCIDIQEFIQEQKSKSKILDYLHPGFWNGFNVKCLIIALSISWVILSLAVIYKLFIVN